MNVRPFNYTWCGVFLRSSGAEVVTDRHSTNDRFVAQVTHREKHGRHCGTRPVSMLRHCLMLLAATTMPVGASLFTEAGEIIVYPDYTLAPHPLGGLSSPFPSSSLADNRVIVIRGSIDCYVYGGVIDGNGEASGNSVSISSGVVSRAVIKRGIWMSRSVIPTQIASAATSASKRVQSGY